MSETTTGPREFLEFVIASLAEHPDQVEFTEIDKNRSTTYELGLHPDDLAALTGEGGRVAAALRTVLDACAYKHQKRAQLVILDESTADDASDDGEEAST